MKKFLSIILVIVIMMSSTIVVSNAAVGDNVYSEVENNNSISSANLIYNDYTVHGKCTPYDLDYYAFTLYSTAEVRILCVSERRSIAIGIVNKYDEVIAASTDLGRTDGGNYGDALITTLPAGEYAFFILDMEDSRYTYSYTMYFTNNGATQHTHSYYTAKIVNPTCTERGYTIYECSCGDSYEGAYVNPNGHAFGEWFVSKEPTVESVGEESRICNNCNEYEVREIPKVEAPTEKPEDDLTEKTSGDVNNDGIVSAIDARIVLQVVAEIKSIDSISMEVADLNGDGKITAIDARIILQIVAGLK